MKEIIAVKDGPQAAGPYSTAVRQNGFVFLSGQIPLNPATNELVTGRIEDQTSQVIENLQAVLKAAGLTLGDVIKTTVFLKDMDDFARMNQTYGKYFAAQPPARSTIQVARLPRDVGIEIEAIAIDTRATRL
jgi:2-iminobutanoate/2-iminopropanoate deaminase